MIKQMLAIFIGLSSGVVISGAVFAFIAVIGVVPRLAQKTDTAHRIIIYEEAIILGGLFGVLADFFHFSMHGSSIVVTLLSLAVGIFFGCVAVSLAEVLDVIPILTRRTGTKQGIFFIITSIAIGKLAGSLIYFLNSGFYNLD